jgi:hypothetical protein
MWLAKGCRLLLLSGEMQAIGQAGFGEMSFMSAEIWRAKLYNLNFT